MFESVTAYVIGLSSVIPIELFAVVSSFLEEIIAPIPSPLVGAVLGSLALASGSDSWLFLVWLGFLAALGKTLACAVIYYAVANASTAAIERFGEHVGVRHEDLIAVSSYFTGSARDYVILILARAIPFIPSLPISIAAGLIKTPIRFYLIATLIGTFLRDTLFIFIGYLGLSAYFAAIEKIASIESLVMLGLAAGALGLLIGLFFAEKRKKKSP